MGAHGLSAPRMEAAALLEERGKRKWIHRRFRRAVKN